MIEYLNFGNVKSNVLFSQLQSYNLTRALINQELTGIFSSETLRDMNDILNMYQIYTDGADFTLDQSSGDWSPAELHIKQIRTLIDKEARFLFAKSPSIKISDPLLSTTDSEEVRSVQTLVKKVLKTNHFNSKLVRAAKDCLIGKRIAIIVNFNERTGIDISFVPSLEFVYETDPTDVDIITKFIQVYSVVVNDDKTQQRIYKKKWYLENGVCRVIEEMYDGNARLVETITPDQATNFTYIPVAIVLNEGLSGDPFGTSEVAALSDTESIYSKLSSKDIDSLRKGADQITYTLDVDPRTTANLSRAPGAYWDIATDPAQESRGGQIGTLENSMSYSSALDLTLKRLKASMYSQVDVPDTTAEALQGVITSGKTLQAIYWGLTVRCDEKMLDWRPALESMVQFIVDGAKLYPNIGNMYVTEPLTEEFEITIENNYPILQDETEEKANDMAEVEGKIMSRKSYMKKWYGLTDEAAESELLQIQRETELLEQDNFSFANPLNSDTDEPELPQEEELESEVEELEESEDDQV